MSLNFFNRKLSEQPHARYHAVNALRGWLQGKTHLPKDVMAALYYLVPELAEKPDEFAGYFSDEFSE